MSRRDRGFAIARLSARPGTCRVARAKTGDPKKETGGAAVVIFTPGLVLRQPVATQVVGVGGECGRLNYVPAPAATVLLFGADPIAREP